MSTLRAKTERRPKAKTPQQAEPCSVAAAPDLEHVACRSYDLHRFEHVRAGEGWICGVCSRAAER